MYSCYGYRKITNVLSRVVYFTAVDSIYVYRPAIDLRCRLDEVLSAKWSDADLEKGVFIVRAQNSKSKRLRAVPLNDSALEVLKQLDTQQYLFMNQQTGKPYTTITKVWDRLRKAAGLPHLRLHDLRHQFASFLVNDGRTLYEVQQILGHSDPKATMRYAHLSTKALRYEANSAAVKIRG